VVRVQKTRLAAILLGSGHERHQIVFAIDDVVGVRGDAFAVEVRHGLRLPCESSRMAAWLSPYGYRSAPLRHSRPVERRRRPHVGEEMVLARRRRVLDLGYPRTVSAPMESWWTIYYFNDDRSASATFAATIWDPGVEGKAWAGKR